MTGGRTRGENNKNVQSVLNALIILFLLLPLRFYFCNQMKNYKFSTKNSNCDLDEMSSLVPILASLCEKAFDPMGGRGSRAETLRHSRRKAVVLRQRKKNDRRGYKLLSAAPPATP